MQLGAFAVAGVGMFLVKWGDEIKDAVTPSLLFFLHLLCNLDSYIAQATGAPTAGQSSPHGMSAMDSARNKRGPVSEVHFSVN